MISSAQKCVAVFGYFTFICYICTFTMFISCVALLLLMLLKIYKYQHFFNGSSSLGSTRITNGSPVFCSYCISFVIIVIYQKDDLQRFMLFQPHTEPVRVCDVSSLSLDAAHPRVSRHRLLLLHNDRTASRDGYWYPVQ